MKLEEIGFYTLSNERAQNASFTSQMKRGEIVITENCNFKCPYCRGLKDEIYGNRKQKLLSFEEIKKVIDFWCEGEPIENIRFSGGEPTLHPNIVEIIEYASSKGIQRIAISTNGSNYLSLYKELIEAGCNDFSISLDACCASDGDKMAGSVENSWQKVVENIREISKLTYVTVGVVLTPENILNVDSIIQFAHDLGVADIRIISAAQFSEIILKANLSKIEPHILDAHPILKYRTGNLLGKRNVRGLTENDCEKCHIVKDDSAVAGNFHFPCIIYMREQGKAIGLVGPYMRNEREWWFDNHNSYEDPICSKNCLDVCIDYNNVSEGGT